MVVFADGRAVGLVRHTHDGVVVAEAPARPFTYGETQQSIIAVIDRLFAPKIIGMSALDREAIHAKLNRTVGNPTAKFAIVDTNPSSPYYGRVYVTWTGVYGDAQRYLSSPIPMAYSGDGGRTWSAPKEISGSNAQYCTYQTDGPAGECDEDQASAPRVGPDGTLYVAFLNEQTAHRVSRGEQFEDQYLIVKSSNGGRTFTAPRHIVDLEDGDRDYPLNVDGSAGARLGSGHLGRRPVVGPALPELLRQPRWGPRRG